MLSWASLTKQLSLLEEDLLPMSVCVGCSVTVCTKQVIWRFLDSKRSRNLHMRFDNLQ